MIQLIIGFLKKMFKGKSGGAMVDVRCIHSYNYYYYNGFNGMRCRKCGHKRKLK